MRSNEWQDNAICRSVGSEPFFDDSGTSDSKPSMAARVRRWRGKQICAYCPVANTCLRHALEVNATYGIFGGVDQRERGALRRGRTASKEIVEIARRMHIDGMSLAAISRRLGYSTEQLREWYRAHPGGPTSRLALAEYAAWPDVEAGLPPDTVSREHQIPRAMAEDMCKAMDRDPDYGGPVGRNRYGTRAIDAAA